MKPTQPCKARRDLDQMRCLACGLVWDLDDRDPPKCNKGERVAIPTPVKPTQENLK